MRESLHFNSIEKLCYLCVISDAVQVRACRSGSEFLSRLKVKATRNGSLCRATSSQKFHQPICTKRKGTFGAWQKSCYSISPRFVLRYNCIIYVATFVLVAVLQFSQRQCTYLKNVSEMFSTKSAQ